MSTRSDIIVQKADGSWNRIYCHFDGYPSGVGATLLEHYNSRSRAEALVRHGDMSILAPKMGRPKGHSFENQVPGYCVFYGRDRGEKNVGTMIGRTLDEIISMSGASEEFHYVWMNGQWHLMLVGPCLEFAPLTVETVKS